MPNGADAASPPVPPGSPPAPPDPAGGPSRTEYYYRIYEAIWRNMERENVLINFRNQWAIVLSGGILATEGILTAGLKEAAAVASPGFARAGILVLMFALSGIAIFFCLMAKQGVWAAQDQIDYLKAEYDRHKTGTGHSFFEHEFGLPRPFGTPLSHDTGHVAATTFPRVLLSIWIILAVLQFTAAVVILAASLQ